MHLYIMPRGILHESQRFIRELSSLYFPMTLKGKMREQAEREMDMKIPEGRPIHVQLAVRPLIPYELVFPAHANNLKLVLKTIYPNEEYPKSQNWQIKMMKRIFRKIVGARELKEEEWEKGFGLPLYKKNVGVDLIGVKEDKTDEDGNEML